MRGFNPRIDPACRVKPGNDDPTPDKINNHLQTF
jgi:hypothetical protein